MKNNLIQLIVAENSPEQDAILKGLKEYNISKAGKSGHLPLTLAIKDDSLEVIAGLVGQTSRGWLYIDFLWVSESVRGQDLGTDLLVRAEEEARKRGCHSAHLATFTFQALDFYKKQGYAVFAELEDYPKGFSRFYLKKKLI